MTACLMGLVLGLFVASFASVGPVEAEGLVQPFREVKLSSQVEAKLYRVEAKEGDRVEAGRVLAVLHSELDRLERDRAEKILERAQAVWESNQRLSKERVVSEEKAMESRLAYEVAKIDLERARALIEEKTLRAPWAGQIIRRFAEEGETVSRSKEIFQLVDYSQVYVTLYLEGRYIRDIREGTAATVSIPLLGFENLPAQVAFANPVVDGGSGLFRVKLLLPNPDGAIKPGVRARVRFEAVSG